MKQYFALLALLSFLALPAMAQDSEQDFPDDGYLEEIVPGSRVIIKKKVVLDGLYLKNRTIAKNKDSCQLNVFSDGEEIHGPIELSQGLVLTLKSAKRKFIEWNADKQMCLTKVTLNFSTPTQKTVRFTCWANDGWNEMTIGAFKKRVLGSNAKLSPPKTIKL